MRTDTLSIAWIFCTETQPIQNKEQYHYFPCTFVLEGGEEGAYYEPGGFRRAKSRTWIISNLVSSALISRLLLLLLFEGGGGGGVI